MDINEIEEAFMAFNEQQIEDGDPELCIDYTLFLMWLEQRQQN